MVLSLLGSEGMLRASAVCKRLQAAASMVDEVQFRALRKPMSLPQATRIFERFPLALRRLGRLDGSDRIRVVI